MKPPEFEDRLTIEGTAITIRTMHPEDREIEADFVRNLSRQSRYYRFHGVLRELTTPMLDHFTRPDYPREMALIATIDEGGTERQIGVVRYAPTRDDGQAEIAIVVADAWQGKGLGSRMLRDLCILAREAGYTRLQANILAENERMLGLAREFGFTRIETRGGDTALELGKAFASD
jgi:acetyltransferase